jgi:NitT/TauT family transport system substrate-binding protein
MNARAAALALPSRYLTAALLATGLVASFGPAPTAADQLPTIRVATIPIDAGSEVYYAQTMHFFEKAGINVEITGMNSGAAVTAAVVAGAADIGQSNAVSLAEAHEHGVPVVFVAPANSYSLKASQAGLLVRNDSPIHNARDFAGKTVGISGLRGITEAGTLNWIDKNGGDSKTVHFLDLPFPEMASAVEAHRIDAALVTEPVLSAALNTKQFRVVADPYSAIASDFLMGGWFATPAWVKAHPQAAAAFSKAILETAHWANAHHAESAVILESVSQAHMGTTVHRVPFAEALRAADLQPLIDVCAKYGLLKAPFPAAELFP